IIADDFLTVESYQVSHINHIVMNPPFSNAVEHILHAYHIAPAGCKITALCNVQTIKNPYSKSREELITLINEMGSWRSIGEAFKQSERFTAVEVALIKLEKPGGYNQEFEGFFLEEEEEEKTGSGLMPYNVVRDLVNRYVESIKI